MRLTIQHTTRYRFEEPIRFGLQQLRKTPRSDRGQTVEAWQVSVDNGTHQLSFMDQHRNHVDLVSMDRDTQDLVVSCQGMVEVEDTAGVLGAHRGPTPLWYYDRKTELTQPGKAVRALARQVEGDSDLDRLHALSALIHEAVAYEAGVSAPDWTAETVLAEAKGVCQDQTHVFLACARELGLPARYVSGYLMLDDRTSQEAMHAWAEAHVPGLGWVGFDVSNGISPDGRYVRVAVGLDYLEAAPITGTRQGGAGETLSVDILVAAQ